MRFQPKGLEKISIGDSWQHNITCYNQAGEEISADSPMSEIARMSCNTDGYSFSVLLNGNELTVHSLENATGGALYIPVVLVYDYTTRLLSLEIRPGEPMLLVDFFYSMENLKSNPRAKTDHMTERFVNDGDKAFNVELRPYLGVESTALLTTERLYDGWWQNLTVDIPYPTLAGDQWTVSQTTHSTRFETTEYYTTADWNHRVNLEVPPHSSVKVTTTIRFARAEVPFWATFRNPVSGHESLCTGTCTVTVPAEYHLEPVTQ